MIEIKIKNELKVNFKYIFIFIVIIAIPNLPYKIPTKISDSNLVELELIFDQSTGGPYVKSGNDDIKEYAKKNGYSKIDSGQIYLTNDNNIIKTLRDDIQGAQGIIKYRKLRVYGEIIGNPDQYGVLTFDVKKWYPIGKYVAIKDTNIWVEKYRIFYFIFLIISVSYIMIKEYILKKQKNGYKQ